MMKVADLYPQRFHMHEASSSYPLRGADSKYLPDFISSLKNENRGDNEIALYVNIPFCDSICTFCCFYSTLKTDAAVGRYLEALKAEIQMYTENPYIKSSKYSSMYFGGGTPSALSLMQLIDLLIYCQRKFEISNSAEITVEGSTSNFDEQKLNAVLKTGCNRLSFGIQTFNDSLRKLLNLQDTASHASEIIRIAQKAGCKNIDIDLIYNLPGQTLADWKQDLKKAIDLEVESISCFPLTVHSSTKLAKLIKHGKVPPIGDKNVEIEMYVKAAELLTEAGYKQQRFIAQFTLPGKEFRYGGNPYQECLALGSNATGYLRRYLYKNIKPLTEYLKLIRRKELPIVSCAKLSKEDEMRRFMVRGLGSMEVDKKEFQRLFGERPEDVFPNVIMKLEKMGLITTDDSRITLKDLSAIWGHNVCAEFLPKTPATFEEPKRTIKT